MRGGATILLATMAGTPWPAAAETGSRTISLAEALELAALRSFPVRHARAAEAVAASEERAARWRLAPSLGAAAGMTGVDGATQSSSTGELDRARFTTAHPHVRLWYETNPIAAGFGLQAARRRTLATTENVNAARRAAREAAAHGYWNLVEAHARTAIAERTLTEASEIERITEILERQGQARGDDLARARSQHAQAQETRLVAERAYREASIGLARSLALEPTVPLVPSWPGPSGPLRPISADSRRPIEAALDRRPELKAAVSARAGLEAEGSAGWAAVLGPKVSLFYEEGALGPDPFDVRRRRGWGILLGWTMRPGDIAAVSTNRSRTAAAGVHIEDVRSQITAEVAAAELRVELGAARREPAARALAAAEDALRIATIRFRNGNALLLELLQAQTAVEVSRLGQLAATVEHERARTHLEAVTAAGM